MRGPGMRDRTASAARLTLVPFLGAPSCPLSQDARLMASVGRFLGKGSLNIVIPANPSLRGLRAYSQVMVLDKSANTAGLAVSNGLTTAIGG